MSVIVDDMQDTAPIDEADVAGEKPEATIAEQNHVNQILKTIQSDKKFHEKAFKRMKDSMFMAFHGRDETWSEKNYKANIAGRHVKQKTNALYAKNPKASAARNERMDFVLWDENPQSLQTAFNIVEQAALATQAAASMPPTVDPVTGAMLPAQPQLPPGFAEAQQLIADFQQGTAYRDLVDKIGRTLEILFARALRDQEPLDFKMAAKALVRRACTCGVSYIEMGFVRQYGPRPDLDAQLADAQARLDHLRVLTERALSGDIDEDAAEMHEIEVSIQALTTEPEIVLREGLVFDFPQSTKVIPDKLTKQLVGFVGARHLTIEYLFTIEQCAEMFPDADLEKGGYRGYGPDGKDLEGPAQGVIPFDDDEDSQPRADENGKGLVCVYKHYDKLSGLVYYVADGHKRFLRPPAAPDVFVEKFWPVFALTFNAVESEDQLFPKSDVELLADQQMEHNRARHGMREHRQAARPRWVTSKGLMDEGFRDGLETAPAFSVTEVNKDPGTKIEDVMEPIPVPGVDPNLYETAQFEQDRMMAVGTSEAAMGGISKATATETAISANATMASDDSSKDDLDDFLSMVARAASQIMFKEMSEEQVKKIVGPGAVWPQQSLAEIANEVYLEVEAGSSGRPNQAVEIENFTKMWPVISVLPNLNTVEVAKMAARRLDDRMDINKLISVGTPSIMSLNSQAQTPTGDPATDPASQGQQGSQNGEKPPEQESPGSDASFGSNQVDRLAA